MATSSDASSEKGGSLTKKLRRYFTSHVKISEADMERTRRIVADYVDDKVMRYCKEKSTLPILRLEYTGSVYTRLKTEAADEVDIMVVLKTTKQEVTVQSTSAVPGYALLKASETSPLHKYADHQGYIDPERLRNAWFYSLVYQAVTDPKASSSPLQMQVRAHGPAVQLDINEKSGQNLLSADLVPCFHIADNYYVAKPYKGARNVGYSDLLWRLSSSMEEKKVLEYMDRDHGCRHELLRIMKTIVKREATSLGKLTSYHLKTVFLQYMNKKCHEWTGPNSLGDNFLGFTRELKDCLERGTIEQYRQPRVNLLEDIDPVVIRKMADRLKRILDSEVERYKILDN